MQSLNGVEIEGDEPEQETPKPGRKAHAGPWEVGEKGRSLIARSIMVPPKLWALAQAVSAIQERKGASIIVREALVHYFVRAATDDPRIARAVQQIGAGEMLGVTVEDDGQ